MKIVNEIGSVFWLSENQLNIKLEELDCNNILTTSNNEQQVCTSSGRSATGNLLKSINTNNVIDPTGSGNNSTGSALYAYCEGYSGTMIGTMANVASSINLQYFGAIPDVKQHREKAEKLKDEVYKNFQI